MGIRITVWSFALIMALAMVIQASSAYHVAVSGLNTNPGTAALPFLTIQKASDVMQPGDTCYVHAGTYREQINPQSGTSDQTRVVYKAVSGEEVYLKGSNRVTTWTLVSGNVWQATFPDSYWGSLNPYTTNVNGDYMTYGQQYHLGEVYLNNEPYSEVLDIASVNATAKTWYAAKAGTTTTITANFSGSDPNTVLAEINVRKAVFFPATWGTVNYVTIDGFIICHGATQWSGPSVAAGQEGIIGTNFGRSWIIQNCTVSDSKCVGICIGWRTDLAYQGKQNSIGHHLIRNNHILRCGQAGICGKYAMFGSIIEGNLIEEINFTKHFGGWEGAGIKVHRAVDLTIRNNVIRKVYNPAGANASCFGIWIDYGNQGTRIAGNVIYQIDQQCIQLEMNHGPTLIDNNVLVGPGGLSEWSENTVFVHNLLVNFGMSFAGSDGRSSEIWTPHTLNYLGGATYTASSDKFYNNIFAQQGSNVVSNYSGYACDYNVLYQEGQKSSWGDAHSIVNSSFSAGFQITSRTDGVDITFNANAAPKDVACPLITRDFIGINQVTKQGIENPDGSAITVDRDMLGNSRDLTHPAAGPFEDVRNGSNTYHFSAGPTTLSNPTRGSLNNPGIIIAPGFRLARSGCLITARGNPGTIVRVLDLKGGEVALRQIGWSGNASINPGVPGIYLVKASTAAGTQRIVLR